MTPLPISPLRLRLVNWHKWVGISVLLFVALRLLWRFAHPPPVFLPMPRWQRGLAHGLHGTLYMLMFALPVSGWFYNNAGGISSCLPRRWCVCQPSLVDKDKVQSLNSAPLAPPGWGGYC